MIKAAITLLLALVCAGVGNIAISHGMQTVGPLNTVEGRRFMKLIEDTDRG